MNARYVVIVQDPEGLEVGRVEVRYEVGHPISFVEQDQLAASVAKIIDLDLMAERAA